MPSMHEIITELARYTRDSDYTAKVCNRYCAVYEDPTATGDPVWYTEDPAAIDEAIETVLNYMDEAEVDEQTAMDAWAKTIVDCL